MSDWARGLCTEPSLIPPEREEDPSEPLRAPCDDIEDCPRCDGDGHLECPGCRGKGVGTEEHRIHVHRTFWRTVYVDWQCPDCDGTGVIPCGHK